jgi:hypothetical protein
MSAPTRWTKKKFSAPVGDQTPTSRSPSLFIEAVPTAVAAPEYLWMFGGTFPCMFKLGIRRILVVTFVFLQSHSREKNVRYQWILPSAASLVPPQFSILSLKGMIFGKKNYWI